MSTVPMAGLRLQFCPDPGEFLAAAADYLAADPVVSTVVTTVAHRLLSQLADGIAQPDRNWWLVVRDESGAVGRRCVVGSADVLDRCRVRGQIASASSVNAAATRRAGGVSTALLH